MKVQTGEWLLTIPQILYAYEDESGEDVIASLDFWGRAERPA